MLNACLLNIIGANFEGRGPQPQTGGQNLNVQFHHL